LARLQLDADDTFADRDSDADADEYHHVLSDCYTHRYADHDDDFDAWNDNGDARCNTGDTWNNDGDPLDHDDRSVTGVDPVDNHGAVHAVQHAFLGRDTRHDGPHARHNCSVGLLGVRSPTTDFGPLFDNSIARIHGHFVLEPRACSGWK
jgi:hypothetical protein